jgi:hypothetical protein
MTISPVIVAVIVAIVTGGAVSALTQLIKKALKLSGIAALVLTALVCTGCTAFYFLVLAPPFILWTFVIYDAAVFGEASGLYHLAGLLKTTPAA